MAFLLAIAASTVFGGIGGLLGSLAVKPHHLPAKKKDKTVVRLYVGSLSLKDDFAGHVPSVTLWDEYGQLWGKRETNKHRVQRGGFVDIDVEANDKVGNSRPAYVSIVNGGSDGICISAVGFAYPEGVNELWLGDIGFKCGMRWEHSRTPIGLGDHMPPCLWLDQDNSYNKGLPQGISFHMRDFTATPERLAQYNHAIHTMCMPPRVAVMKKATWDTAIPMYDPPLEYTANLTDVNLERVFNPADKWTVAGRGNKSPKHGTYAEIIDYFRNNRLHNRDEFSEDERPVHMQNTIITSNYTQHSAVHLCASPTSYSSDFVSLQEQIYCDMASRQMYPLCGVLPSQSNSDHITRRREAALAAAGATAHPTVCFDLETNNLRYSMEHAKGLLEANSTFFANYTGPNAQSFAALGAAGALAALPVKAYTNIENW